MKRLPKQVFKVVIDAPIEKVWQELTKKDGLCAHFFNSRLHTTELAIDAPIRMRSKNGKYTTVVGEILAIEKAAGIEANEFELFHIPSATYAEFNCTYHASAKMNKYIYGEWFSSTGYERDESKPDIAAYFPVAFRPMKDMGVRWWIPIVEK